MKNKLLVFSLTALSLFTLTGCNMTSDTQSLSSLETQLSRIESSITTNGNDDISTVSPYSSLSDTTSNSIQTHKANSYNNMTRENKLKEEIISLNSTLKSCMDKDLKLGKTKASSIKSLSSNISKNLNKYNKTKNQVKSSVKNIKKSLKVPNVDVLNAESEYITLNGNMNERYAYLCNIYDNLEEAYLLICDCCDNTTNSQITNEITNETTKTTGQKTSKFKKNIDSYAPSQRNIKENKVKSNQEQNTTADTDDTNSINDIRNIDSFNNFVPPNQFNNPYYNNQYGYPYGYYNGYNNRYNGYGYGYGYNNGYGYANGYRRFNPNGNTDSFYPYNRNIDTYRMAPNMNYPVNANPIENDYTDNSKTENLESEEKTKSNNVIEFKTSDTKQEDTFKLDEDSSKIEEVINDSKDIKENLEEFVEINENKN